MDDQLDIDACRRLRPYSKREYVGRVLWALATPLFKCSPRTFFGWRRSLLRLFGASVGRNAHVYPSATIYLPWNLRMGEEASIGEWVLIYNLGPVSVGARATISHRAHLCAGTHEYRDRTMPLRRMPIEIGDQAWICAGAYVGPGIRIGEGAVVGAGAVATRDVEPWQVVAGNPARVVKTRKLSE